MKPHLAESFSVLFVFQAGQRGRVRILRREHLGFDRCEREFFQLNSQLQILKI
jgi:hypothetical protein